MYSYEPLLHQAATRLPKLRKVAETPFKIQTNQTKNPFSLRNPNNKFLRGFTEGAVNAVKDTFLGNPADTEKAMQLNFKQATGKPVSSEEMAWQTSRVGQQAPMVGGLTSPVKRYSKAKANKEWLNWYRSMKKEIDNTPIDVIEDQVLNKTRDNGTMTPKQAREYNKRSQEELLKMLGY